MNIVISLLSKNRIINVLRVYSPTADATSKISVIIRLLVALGVGIVIRRRNSQKLIRTEAITVFPSTIKYRTVNVRCRETIRRTALIITT